MPARKISRDIFANIAHLQCVESAANTLTFKKLETGITLFERMAWIICRIEYFIIIGSYGLLLAANDGIKMCIATSDNPSTIDFDEASQVDIAEVYRRDIGTAGTGLHVHTPIVKNLTELPGGGLIVPPNPLYLGVQGESLATPATIDVRIFYTAKELKAEEYWELVEARRIISSS